ncbi:MAG TPA: MFS transporter [Eoetvoesiella sp.]|jgi:MFS family permease|uniref:MFS transporter n=1 Tax=Eoetvoesiella sp. TaxID=1966355 RepID=UPI002C45BB36|nr:MFS transporter [Eoetvoesiella sp.]HWK62409.1 MFS transporter [Eoetvoesiella sp.]
MQDTKAASWGELLSGRNGLRSIALAGGVALHAVNVYIATTILPSVVEDIGGLEYYAWNTTLFVAASIFGSAISPKTMHLFGPRRAFLAAIILFALGTAVCAAAPTMLWMLAGRTVQGLGGGLLLGLSYSSIRLVFEERLWPLATGLTSSMWGVATLSGPAIGGIFAESGHWRWAFWAVLPCCAGLAWLVTQQIAVKASGQREAVKVPLPQIALLVASVLVISIASLSPHVGWNALGIAVGLVIGLGVARIDKSAAVRLMPTGGYALKGGMGSLYACVCLLSIGITVEVFVPYFLQVIHGYAPLVAGYMTALMSAGWTLGSITSSSRSAATARKLLRSGPVVSALALAALAVLVPWTDLNVNQGAIWWLLLPLLGVGLGIGMCWPHLLTQVFKASPPGEENMASSAIITIQLYAMALGATLGGMIANAAGLTQPGGLEGTRHAALALFAVFTLSPAAAGVFMASILRTRRAAEQPAAA